MLNVVSLEKSKEIIVDVIAKDLGKPGWQRHAMFVLDERVEADQIYIGECWIEGGQWSSYPPHHHPQPEVYYYQFDKPQGFGACFNADEVYKSVDSSACFIHDGEDHQQVVAPGYNMYYVWMIRHLENDPWYKTTRFVSPEHEWLTKG